ncbi:MAG: sodium/proline symporter [Candidatus Marinimicrobia bacterium]|jgi:sodium/proline symporter|nr:sodium/proline symporter [Candidatus Neomarinimicrobiota bacterium]MBT3632000.1 sodium/proline symporter [Candidatus Neomarinimicrobiota bacterium]MBT3824586.1 sodium/proline symporter [Candidatus Neomarinimicrobiota bacterium]MBT4130239.1 sodium/proline symporter [Candidatus Neomarinimicrobiota bacterium]MBT4296990.1 sodium/proline symporter [Candidatus Neomarinimicrobiota bacterium]
MDPVTLGFLLYLALILGVGFYTAHLTKSMKDFALGGQRLGPWVIAFSERASGESAWLILGLPGAALLAGLLELWTVVGCISGIIFSWFFIARRLREATEEFDALTIPELFAKRFQDDRGILRILASLIITFFFTFYVAAQFSGAGKVLNVTFGITHMQGMLLGAVIIVFYTLMGGFLAVAWTDLVQGIIMLGTLIVLPLVALIEISALPAVDFQFDGASLFAGKAGMAALAAAIGGLSWGLGYMGQPHLVTRYMAIDKAENIKISRRIAISWAVPAFFGSMFIGLTGYFLLQAGSMSFDGQVLTSAASLSDPEKLMPIMAQNLLHPWIAGIFISGAIAAMMSTADSQLLVSTTVLTEDLIANYFQRLKDRFDILAIGRGLTIFIGLLAFYLAWQSTDLVFEMVSYAWGGLGASFGPALLLTLWWKRISKVGVIAGMVTGTLFTVFDLFGEWVSARFSAFIIAFLAVYIFSILKPDES